MSNYYDAQVAVREAWKRSEGKYPMDDPELDVCQREADRHLQMVLNLTAEVESLQLRLRTLAQYASHRGICKWFEDAEVCTCGLAAFSDLLGDG